MVQEVNDREAGPVWVLMAQGSTLQAACDADALLFVKGVIGGMRRLEHGAPVSLKRVAVL